MILEDNQSYQSCSAALVHVIVGNTKIEHEHYLLYTIGGTWLESHISYSLLNAEWEQESSAIAGRTARCRCKFR